MGKPMVLSIMGAGHSGSTVLGIALGNHPKLETVGEVFKLARSGWIPDDNRRCACGSAIHQCAYWQEIQRVWLTKVAPAGLQDYIALQNRFERSRRDWPRLLLENARRSLGFNRYAHMTAAFYTAVQEVSGQEIVVDTSKIPVRNYALLLNDQIKARVIHLVRDGRGVVWSGKKPRRKNVDAGIPRDFPTVPARHTSQDWVFTNLESSWVAATTGKNRSIRVLYEQFMENPCAVFQQIGQLIDVDLSPVAELLTAGETLRISHLVGGNQVRMAKSLVLRPDAEWKQMLPANDQRTFWYLAGWLAQRYGYRF